MSLIRNYPAYGTLRVGGYTFTNFTETSVNIQPVKSLDGRTVSYSSVTIDIHAFIVGNNNAGVANLEAAFAIPNLQKSGVGITYSGRGLDRLFSGFGRDIAWGPMPGSLRIKPLGGVPANAFEVNFSIEARVPTCPMARFAGPIDMAVSITFEVDYAGYGTRTFAGRLRIANNLRPDGRGGTDSPDRYRSDVTPALLPGFYRKFGPWVTSEDKTELSFTIIDSELPGLNVPPAWVVGEPVLSHHVASVSMGTQGGMKRYSAHFSGRYELAKDAPDANWPAIHFFEVFVNGEVGRITFLKNRLSRPGGTGNPSTILPVAVEFGEPNVLGRRVSEFSATFLFADDLWTVFENVGMWSPLPGSNWRQWATSLSTSAFNPYGTAQAIFNTNDDQAITGLCSSAARASAGQVTRELRTMGTGFDEGDWVDRILRAITPKNSWLEYDNHLAIIPESGTVEIRTLPTKPPPSPGAPNTDKWAEFDRILGAKFDAMNGRGLPAAGVINPGSQNPIGADPGGTVGFQRRVPDSFKVVMEGHALRAGFPIPAPTLTTIGGARAVPMFDGQRDFWNHKIVTNAITPVFGAAWRFTYKTDGPIRGPLPPAPNPLLDG